MNGYRRRLLTQTVLFFGLLISVAMVPHFVLSAEPASARILNVRHHRQWNRDVKTNSRLRARRMSKFSEENRPALYDEVIEVLWIPPPGGLKAGLILRLEYIQQQTKAPMSLQITYPFRVEKRRTARFVLPAEAIKAAGQLTSWRVTLLSREQILAEKRCKSWSVSQ